MKPHGALTVTQEDLLGLEALAVAEKLGLTMPLGVSPCSATTLILAFALTPLFMSRAATVTVVASRTTRILSTAGS